MGLVEVFDEPARKVVVALIVVIKNTQDVQQRRLAGARRTHDGNDLAVLYVEAASFQHMERVRRAEIVGLMDIFEMKHSNDLRFTDLRFTIFPFDLRIYDFPFDLRMQDLGFRRKIVIRKSYFVNYN